MSLAAKIESDLKQAMLAKETERVSVLRMLKSAVKYAAVEKVGADGILPDGDVLAVVRKEIKKRQDSISSYEQANRPELAEKEKKEASILASYLPPQMTADQVEALVKQVIQETGATGKAQMGIVMKACQAKAAGQADGKTLSQLVQKLLP